MRGKFSRRTITGAITAGMTKKVNGLSPETKESLKQGASKATNNARDALYAGLQELGDASLRARADKASRSRDLTDPVVNGTSALVDAFVQGNEYKLARAKEGWEPVLEEISRKSAEIIALSPEEKTELMKRVVGIYETHRDNQSKINTTQEGTALLHDVMEQELKRIKDTTDPKVLESLQKATKFTGGMKTTLKACAPLATVLAVYDLAAALYPEESQQFEQYMSEKIVELVDNTSQKFNEVTESANVSFKNRYHNLVDHAHGSYSPEVNASTTEETYLPQIIPPS